MKIVAICMAAMITLGCAVQKNNEKSISLVKLVKSVPMIIYGDNVGSGILFKDRDAPMILTAAHIIKKESIADNLPLELKSSLSPAIQVVGWNLDEDNILWSCKADIVCINQEIDFAILKLHSVHPAMEFANISAVPALYGEKIYMIGSPALDASTLSSGIICHPHRDPSENPCDIRYIQTDAQGYFGSSGGGIFRETDGSCIGMVVMMNPAYGSMYALPISVIQSHSEINIIGH